MFDKSKKYMKHVYDHRKAFLSEEKKILGKNTVLGHLHDIDKLLLSIFIHSDSAYKRVHWLHRKFASHHPGSIWKKKENHYIQMIIDWQCAHLTKPDKPLLARETMYKYYPELEPIIVPLLDRFKL